MFYDGPSPHPGLFDSLLDVPGIGGDTKAHETFSLFADGVKVPAEIDNRCVLVRVHDIDLTFLSRQSDMVFCPRFHLDS
jgi:hypothetical protein